MNPDDIINNYKGKLDRPPSLEQIERERETTLKKAFNAKVLVKLRNRIVAAYQILADVSRGRRRVSASKVALLAGGLAYLALPLDLICDAIPVAGLVDDGLVLRWIFARCADLLNESPCKSSAEIMV